MTKERSEKIKEKMKLLKGTKSVVEFESIAAEFLLKHGDYLIEQASYLKDREKENEALKKHINHQTQINEDLKQQNKRYREAIDEMKNTWKKADNIYNHVEMIHEIIKELEGNTND